MSCITVSRFHTTIIVALILVGVILTGAIIALYSSTLCTLWLPLIAAASIAFASALWLSDRWSAVTATSNRWVNMACHTVMVTIMLLFGFFALNYFTTSRDEAREQKAEVVARYYKTRHQMKRVSRKVYTQGAEYKVYYIEVRFANGFTKEMSMPYSRFKKLHEGDSITVKVARGGLGLPVIYRDGRVTDVPHFDRRR